MCEGPPGVVLVVGVLEPFVLLDGRRVHQDRRKLMLLQSIDEPVPVERRLDCHALEAFTERLEFSNEGRQLVWQLLLPQNLIVLVDDRKDSVVRMKIDCRIRLHRKLLSSAMLHIARLVGAC